MVKLTKDDKARLVAIWDEDKSDTVRVGLVLAYWRDSARAKRTHRDNLLLHIGMVCGLYLRRVDEVKRLKQGGPSPYDLEAVHRELRKKPALGGRG